MFTFCTSLIRTSQRAAHCFQKCHPYITNIVLQPVKLGQLGVYKLLGPFTSRNLSYHIKDRIQKWNMTHEYNKNTCISMPCLCPQQHSCGYHPQFCTPSNGSHCNAFALCASQSFFILSILKYNKFNSINYKKFFPLPAICTDPKLTCPFKSLV